MKLKFFRNLIIIAVLVVIAFSVGKEQGKKERVVIETGSLASGRMVNTQNPQSDTVDFSLFWDVWGRLEENFIDRDKIDPQKMVYGAISGMVASLGDPYTVFLPPQEQKEAKEELGGTFEGIGAELGMKDSRIVVVSPLKDMPAEKAGIKQGDWIVKVDGADTAGWAVPEAVNKIRGPKGSEVLLTVLHDGDEKTEDISIKRGTILVKTVELTRMRWKKEGESYIRDDACTSCESVQVLRLSRFGDQTNKEWEDAIAQIVRNENDGETRGVILDLRNNPGGYLQGAVYTASEFLEQGKLVVKQTYTNGEEETYSVNRKGKLLNIPLTVLINNGSASASEIVAGALRDHGRAKLVGEKSFGKGSIQQAQELPGGAGLHITIAKWLLPKGDWINSVGVSPDVEVASTLEGDAAEVSDKEQADVEETDRQLEEAAKILLGNRG